MSSPSRREVALASEDDTRGLADPPFQLWYETTFSSSLSTLICSCTFCRRRLWHSVSGHCFPDQVRAVLDEPDPARSSFLIWSCPNVEFFFLLCIFHHRRSHLVFVAGEAVLSPNLHEAAVGAGSAVTATCAVVPSGVHGGYGGFFFDKNRSEKRCSLPIRGPMCGASALCSVASVVVAAGGATCGHRTLHHSVVSAHSWPQGGKGMPLLMK